MNKIEMKNKFLSLLEAYTKGEEPESLNKKDNNKVGASSFIEGNNKRNYEKINSSQNGNLSNHIDKSNNNQELPKPKEIIKPHNEDFTEIGVNTLKQIEKPYAKAIIGKAITASKESVFYDPKRVDQNLANMNMMITGSSGKGKTQLLKSLVLQERKQGVNFIIFDYKNDFSNDDYFIKNGGFEYINLERKGLPYNPLIPPVKEDNNEKYWNVQSHIFSIDGVLSNVYGLQVQQASSLRQAIRMMFADNNVPIGKDVNYSEDIIFPNLDSLDEYLKSENPKAYNRMEPVFSLGIFGDEYKSVSLMDLLGGSYIFNLSSIEHDAVKNAITKMVVINAHQYLNSLSHTQKLRNVFVFDEAHRILNEERILGLVRECRAYGLAVWLSSQYTSDYPEEITGSLETKIIHGNGNEIDKIKDIKKTTGFTGADDIVANLDLFDAIVSNSHYPNKIVKTISHPHMLVIKALKGGRISLELKIDGVEDSRKKEMINHLIIINIVREHEGYIELTELGKQLIDETYI